jgi:predicted lipoprotein
MPDRRMIAMVLAAVLIGSLGGCKIVSMGEKNAQQEAGFDGETYATGLWDERVLPFFASDAKPAATVIAAITADLEAAGVTHGYRPGEGSPWAFVVSGSGTVQAINTESRAGTLDVLLDDATPPLTVTLQIGPVIRGNAIRDALPFASFKDFVNQLEYAEAGKALTALAARSFGATVEGLTVGDRVRFSGAITLTRPSDRLQVTPVTLEEVAP